MKKLLKKYKELILYVVFGALTTLVNYVVYFGCKALHIPYQPATVIAWIAAVAFAYITNRIWVFESKTFGAKAICKEIVLFVGARLFSLVLELIIMFIGMDLLSAGERTVVLFDKTLPLGEFVTKTVAQIVIIVSNYVFSKLVVFRKKRENSE